MKFYFCVFTQYSYRTCEAIGKTCCVVEALSKDEAKEKAHGLCGNDSTALSSIEEFNPNEGISCPICDSEKYEFYVNIYGYQYCECQDCKSIFLANLPNAEELYQGKEDVPVEHYVDEEIFNKRKEIRSVYLWA